jgi:asparagine N-glycosylation enzyme membrane subunit Stt3
MNWRFWHNKRVLTATVVIIILAAVIAFLATTKVSYDQENDAVLHYFSSQQGMPDAFSALERLTPTDAVVMCWWDYGRAVEEWSHREVIEAYPSREIAESVGSTRSFLGNLGAQIFAKWGSHEKIQDIAKAFMLKEEQSLSILKKYNATYVLVFVPDELEKFTWIAQIADCDATDYLTYNQETQEYEPTPRGKEVTLLRLIFDDTLQPWYFTQIYETGKAKIYKINY